mmetsp:Transcript_57985/g.149236  ORF Transcript_57985/g.149236 Transcript_57985/m.149236 type:complete len:369 (-) Transcript_57985:109-1215(-)
MRGADAEVRRHLELRQLLLDVLQVRDVGVRARHDRHEAALDEPCLLQVRDNPRRRIHLRRELKPVACDLLVDADVAVGALHDLVVRQLRRLLVLRRIEAHLQQRVPHVLLGELLELQLRLGLQQLSDRLVRARLHLRLDLGVLGLPLLHGAEPRGVRSVHLIDDMQHAVLVRAELVLGVDEDQPPRAHELAAALVELHGGGHGLLSQVLAQERLHLGHRHVLVVPNFRLSRGGENRLGEPLEADHVGRHLQAAEGAVAAFVRGRHAAPQVAAHDQLHVQVLHFLLHHHAAIHVLHERIWDDVRSLREGPLTDHVQDLALEGDQVGQDVVERGHAVVGNHHHIGAGEVDGPHLALLLVAEFGDEAVRQG